MKLFIKIEGTNKHSYASIWTSISTFFESECTFCRVPLNLRDTQLILVTSHQYSHSNV